MPPAQRYSSPPSTARWREPGHPLRPDQGRGTTFAVRQGCTITQLRNRRSLHCFQKAHLRPCPHRASAPKHRVWLLQPLRPFALTAARAFLPSLSRPRDPLRPGSAPTKRLQSRSGGATEPPFPDARRGVRILQPTRRIPKYQGAAPSAHPMSDSRRPCTKAWSTFATRHVFQMVAQLVLDFGRQQRKMIPDSLQAGTDLEYLARGLGADAGHAGNIVAGVAHQSLHVRPLGRADAALGRELGSPNNFSSRAAGSHM